MERTLPKSDRDWESLISLASSEVVLPALHERVCQLEACLDLPSEVADCFSAVAELNRDRNSAVLSQLRDITAALNKAGIEPVLLKGLAYLISGTYTDLGARYLSDIDLLVPIDQLNLANEILQDCGYQPEQNDPVARFRHHLPTFFRTGCLPIELHHSVGLGVCQKLLPAVELIDHSSRITWNGVQLRIPSPDHLVTHLVIHSQLVHPYMERIWPPFRALYDLALLQGRFGTSINWVSLTRRFRSQGQYATLALHLLQAHETLATPLPTTLQMTWAIRLRGTRRHFLHLFPRLRFIDPFFIFYSMFSRRTRVVKRMLFSGGWRNIIKRLFQPELYRRLTSEIDGLP